MATEAISVHVDAEAARPFKATSPGKRRKLEALLSLQLLQAAKPRLPLRELMRRVSERAQELELTEEQLRELLDDASHA
jgi:hypothetical protein